MDSLNSITLSIQLHPKLDYFQPTLLYSPPLPLLPLPSKQAIRKWNKKATKFSQRFSSQHDFAGEFTPIIQSMFQNIYDMLNVNPKSINLDIFSAIHKVYNEMLDKHYLSLSQEKSNQYIYMKPKKYGPSHQKNVWSFISLYSSIFSYAMHFEVFMVSLNSIAHQLFLFNYTQIQRILSSGQNNYCTFTFIAKNPNQVYKFSSLKSLVPSYTFFMAPQHIRCVHFTFSRQTLYLKYIQVS